MNPVWQVISLRCHAKINAPYPVRLDISRKDLPRLCRGLGFASGAEIGVWKGEYSLAFCKAGFSWTCVDPWRPYAEYRDNKNQQELIDMAYEEAMAKLGPYRPRILRMTSAEAAVLVPDRSLDVIYLDGNHESAFILQDLDLWIPKVRSGGLCVGHDYRLNPAKPHIEVKRAIDQYTASHGIEPWAITAADRTPSFLWVVD